MELSHHKIVSRIIFVGSMTVSVIFEEHELFACFHFTILCFQGSEISLKENLNSPGLFFMKVFVFQDTLEILNL